MKKLLLLILMSAGALLTYAQQDFRHNFEDIESIRAAFGKKPQSTANARDGVQGRFLPLLKLDSVVIENQAKYLYTYNADGQDIEEIAYFLNASTGELEFDSRAITEYTANGGSIHTYASWNPLTLAWDNSFRGVRIIDPDTGTTDDYSFTWDASTGTWKGFERYIYLVTPSMESFTALVWNAAANDWEYDYKTEYLKNTAEQIVEAISYSWTNSSWVAGQRQTYDYNAEDQLLGSMTFNWNAATMNWENTQWNQQVYDSAGLRTASRTYIWQTSTNAWAGILGEGYTYHPDSTLATRDRYLYNADLQEWFYDRPYNAYTYTYTPEGRLSEKISFKWLTSLNDLVRNGKENYTYDIAGNVTDYAQYAWSTYYENWRGTSRQVKEYDLSVDIADLIYPSRYDSDFASGSGKLVSIESFSLHPDFNGWQQDSKAYYYFSELTTDTREAPAVESLKVFPNPVGDVLSLAATAANATSYSITDLSGRLLQHEKSWSGNGIDVSRLSTGTYVIKLTEEQKVITARFVKL